MNLIFEWDKKIDLANLQKHKISFEEAKTLFGDPFLVTYPDEYYSETEERLISIGVSAQSKTLLVVHTARQETQDTLTIRLISERKPPPQNIGPLKNSKNNPSIPEPDDMLPEYDFTGRKGERGKYYQAYQKGHSVKIHEEDGTVNVQYFTQEEGAVMLEPDVRKYFPTSESVNHALRTLLKLVPRNPAKKIAKAKKSQKSLKPEKPKARR